MTSDAVLFYRFEKCIESGNDPTPFIEAICDKKLAPTFATIFRDMLHEKEKEIANIKIALNHLGSYSL